MQVNISMGCDLVTANFNVTLDQSINGGSTYAEVRSRPRAHYARSVAAHVSCPNRKHCEDGVVSGAPLVRWREPTISLPVMKTRLRI